MNSRFILLIILFISASSQIVGEYTTFTSRKDPNYGYKAHFKLTLKTDSTFIYEYNQHGSWGYKANGIWKITKDTLYLSSYNKNVFKYPEIIESRVDSIKDKTVFQTFNYKTNTFLSGIRIKANKRLSFTLNKGIAELDTTNITEFELFSEMYTVCSHKVLNKNANYFLIKLSSKPRKNNIYQMYLIENNRLVFLENKKPLKYNKYIDYNLYKKL